jgi:hypothetical protein
LRLQELVCKIGVDGVARELMEVKDFAGVGGRGNGRRKGKEGLGSKKRREIAVFGKGVDGPRGKRKRPNLYIMTFQVSTGKSASLNDQSNCSSATGSSLGSWYGSRKGCKSASAALILVLGSKTSIFSRMSTARGAALGK